MLSNQSLQLLFLLWMNYWIISSLFLWNPYRYIFLPLRWSPFSFFIIIVQSMQWAITAQMFVMTAYLTPSGKTVANGTYTSVRDRYPIPDYEFSVLFFIRYGRRAVLVAVLFGIAIATTACALAPNFWFLILSRFFQGAFLNVKSVKNLRPTFHLGYVFFELCSLYGICNGAESLSGYLLFW